MKPTASIPEYEGEILEVDQERLRSGNKPEQTWLANSEYICAFSSNIIPIKLSEMLTEQSKARTDPKNRPKLPAGRLQLLFKDTRKKKERN
jgi:hypothetical protein